MTTYIEFTDLPPGSFVPFKNNLDIVKSTLGSLDPDMCYGDWMLVLKALHYESKGSEEGFAIANVWSREGRKYKGEWDIRSKWNSIGLSMEAPVTFITILRMCICAD